MSKSYKALFETVKKLREPINGCPWDLKQNIKSLGPSLLEECCECLDGIALNDNKNVKEELGDIIFTSTLMAYILEQEGFTTVDDILTEVNNKMVTRHPHVFKGKGGIKTSDDVLNQWDKIKETEEGRKVKKVLDNIPRSLPPLDKSFEIQKKVEKRGFDWENIEHIFDKIVEETQEVKEEIESQDMEKLEIEIGDLLFSVVNLARFLKINPSSALNRTNDKFINRFNFVEDNMNKQGLDLNKENFKVMDKLWDESKSGS